MSRSSKYRWKRKASRLLKNGGSIPYADLDVKMEDITIGEVSG